MIGEHANSPLRNLQRRRARKKAKPASPMLGRRFERLIVLRRWSPGGYGAPTLWECRCDCGELRVVAHNDLARRRQKSCGCLRRELATRPHSEAHNRKISAALKQRSASHENSRGSHGRFC